MMLLFVLLGLILGYAKGGRLKTIDLSMKGLILPILAFAWKMTLPLWEKSSYPTSMWLPSLSLVEYSLVLLFCFINRERKLPMALMAIGTAGNFAAHLANDFRMPVLASVCENPPLDKLLELVKAGLRPEYVAVDTSAPLWFLGDVIPITVGLPGVASIGDIVLGIGTMILIERLMQGERNGKQ